MDWTLELAYAIGLITTDGCLSHDGRHIELTSKDLDQIVNFLICLNLDIKISTKLGSYYSHGIYYRAQFSNVKPYKFLLSIGLTPNKSKTIGKIIIPDNFFIDFLRGHLDGDGSTSSFWDVLWPNSFRFYTTFISASRPHIEWIQKSVYRLYGLKGSIGKSGKAIFRLSYAKNESIKLADLIYYSPDLICLERKRSKIMLALSIISDRSRPIA